MAATIPDRISRCQHPDKGQGYLSFLEIPQYISSVTSLAKKKTQRVGGCYKLSSKITTGKGNGIILIDLGWLRFICEVELGLSFLKYGQLNKTGVLKARKNVGVFLVGNQKCLLHYQSTKLMVAMSNVILGLTNHLITFKKLEIWMFMQDVPIFKYWQ